MINKRNQMTRSIFVPAKYCICDKCGAKDAYDNMAHIGYNIDRCKKCMGIK